MAYNTLFSRRSTLDRARAPLLAAKPEEPPKEGGTEPVRRVGMFGRMFGKDLPRTLQIFAAGMRDISDPSNNAVNQFRESEAEQQRLAAEEAVQAGVRKREEYQQERSQHARSNFMQTLSPEEQSQFELFPNSFAPLSPEDAATLGIRQQDSERQGAQFEETMRHNRASEGIDYMRASREDRQGMPTLSEARQWTNSYNDDVRSTMNDLGNMRSAIPYAREVVQARGAPRGNFRMNDVALLRAAARAQTGPGVLTEGEVFGTLSPSLQQSLTRNIAYADISASGLRPEDRLALAQYVQQSQRNASGDLWRRYNDAENVLSARNVEPSNVGISPPEYLHPDDMDSFASVPDSSFRQGRNYVAPSGRQYTYLGNGRFRAAGRNEFSRSRSVNPQQRAAAGGQPPAPNRIRIDANGNPIQ
tara:strand:- start:2512 stop:3762 length:1251 start_codon:yes stop_codon:yes gene_type:complete